MRNRFLFAALATAFVLAAPSQAQVATFDALSASGTIVPNGYVGKDWTGVGVLSNTDGYGSHSSSGANYAYVYCCGNTNFITQTGGGSFNFYSAFVGSLQGSTDTYTVTGYDAFNTVLYSQAVTVGAVGYTEIFNWQSVDKVTFSTSYSANLTLDDVEFSSPTPEPASLVLLATGLAGVFGVARRRRRI